MAANRTAIREASGLAFHTLALAEDIRQSSAIVAPTPEVIVKDGRCRTARESQTLLYLEQCVPSFPPPRLYAMHQDGDDFFIVMQRLPGRPLDTVWEELSENDDKDRMTVRPRETFDGMRRVSRPQPSYFGAVDQSHTIFSTCRTRSTSCSRTSCSACA